MVSCLDVTHRIDSFVVVADALSQLLLRDMGPRNRDPIEIDQLTSRQSQHNPSGNGWSMTNSSKYKPAASEWIKWMQTPENMAEWCNLSVKTPPSTKAQALWKPDPCVKDFMDRNAKFQFAGPDTQLLWQESKTICAPHFQAAVLGKIAPEAALANCDKELTALLKERYGAK